MIDFRYHLVSIVSIFLALAVGIVLGAGPLKGEIGATLTDEIAGLRDDKAQLNEQLTAAQRGTESRDAYISAANPWVLDGLLDLRTVALVVLPGVDSTLVEATATTLGTAGARVVSTTSLTESWVAVDDSTTSVRRAVVARVAGAVGVDLEAVGGEVAPRDALLAAMLTTSTEPDAPAVDTAEIDRGLQSLDDAGLLTVDTPDGAVEQAELAVVVSGAVTTGDEEARAAASAQWVDLAVALANRASATVMAAEVDPEADGVWVLTTMRDDADAAAVVSGVDDAGEPMGQASVVLALTEQAAGDVGQYGVAADADDPFAPLPTPTPTTTP